MARIISINTESNTVYPNYSLWRNVLVGFISGLLYFIITLTISDAIGSLEKAGYIATILVATVSILLMLALRVVRPLIVAISSGFVLLGLSQLTLGLKWYEIIIWSVLMYVMSYVSFSWISRYMRTIPVVITAVIVVILVQLTLSF